MPRHSSCSQNPWQASKDRSQGHLAHGPSGQSRRRWGRISPRQPWQRQRSEQCQSPQCPEDCRSTSAGPHTKVPLGIHQCGKHPVQRCQQLLASRSGHASAPLLATTAHVGRSCCCWSQSCDHRACWGQGDPKVCPSRCQSPHQVLPLSALPCSFLAKECPNRQPALGPVARQMGRACKEDSPLVQTFIHIPVFEKARLSCCSYVFHKHRHLIFKTWNKS